MSCQKRVYQWNAVVRTHLPHLSSSQAYVLALWSVGLVLARSCAVSAVSVVLGEAMERPANTVRAQLREWCYEAGAKRGTQRREVEVASCFAPLLGWVLSWWEARQVALALDATTLGERFVVLCVSVLYRGCAIPVAWKVLPATQRHSYRKEWLRLLRTLRPAIPPSYTVIVLADRGLYGRWLFRRIVRLGWHPFLRVNKGGTFRPHGHDKYAKLHTFGTQVGGCWSGAGRAFQGGARQLDCTLLVYWEKGCAEPWLILTDLPPSVGQACWYGLRAWIEAGFKLTKRGGWQWQRTRMTDPGRASRLWLAIAVATLWVLGVGGEAEANVPPSSLQDEQGGELNLAALLAQAPARRQRAATQARLVSIFRRGCAVLMKALLNGQPWPSGHFVPEPWPALPPGILDLAHSDPEVFHALF